MLQFWRESVPLAPYTTLGVGGVARYLASVSSGHALQETVAQAQALALPFVVIGGGSNLLVSDAGYPGLVIAMAIGGITEVQRGEVVLVTAGAGVVLDELVAWSTERGYWGLENLSHIPGTVGATPIQNVGAYGVEVSDVIESVTVYDPVTGREMQVTNQECMFGYRTSRFKTDVEKRFIVTAVTVRLSRTPAPRVEYADLARHFSGTSPDAPEEVRAAVIAIRSRKFPDWQTVGTAGSFFKNPIISAVEADVLRAQYPDMPCYVHTETHVKCSLGYILDKVCGLRGYRHGHVRLYEAQALVLVAEPGATALEIDDFARFVAGEVYKKTGIEIEREVQIV